MSMRWFLPLLLLLALGLFAQAPVVQPGARIAVVGDSITEQKMYSRYIELYLMACLPELKASVMQFGWGGERAIGFANRMQNDLMPFKPTVVTTCYGMNDGGYGAFSDNIGKAYENPMRDIVTRLKAAGVTVVVGSPGAVDTKYFVRGNNPEAAPVYNDNLNQLRGIAEKIAKEQGMPFADVHTPMVEAMAKAKAALGADFPVCGTDGVHPGANGHFLMAYAFLKAMGFDGNLGSITVDMKGNATAAGGHTVLAAKDGVVELESTRYPLCISGGEKEAGSPRSMLAFVPFQQELNRLTLVVKNLGADRAKITWGAAGKEFAKADLEKGINLAAEFPETPFAAAFKKVEEAVAAKQNVETYMIKNQITTFPSLQKQFPDDPELNGALDVLRNRLWMRQAALTATVRAAVAPVKHTLTIEVVAP